MVDVYAALGHGHQLANAVSIALMFGTFVGVCAFGHISEQQPAPSKPAPVAKQGTRRIRSNAHLKGVKLPPVPKKPVEEVA